MPDIYNVCSSHMDREWHLPFDETRIFFANIISTALYHLRNDPGFCFMLDGQTSVLYDYLEICPEREDEIRKYIKEDRLIIGPWFIQPDEVIPFGESMIRNLLIGEKQAEKFGNVMRIGYVPDSFGHAAQLPQILRQFGIGRAFMMRGVPDSVSREFIWRGPDGSEVISICCEYGNASFMDPCNMREGIRMMSVPEEYAQRKAEAENNPRRVAPYSLITIGGDMQPLPADLRSLGIDRFSRLEDCFDATEKYRDRLPAVEGELRYSGDIRYLEDTLVSRIYLKTENQRVQTLLSQFAEPVSLLAYGTGEKYPGGFIGKAWQYLIENHTHDGICGCSSDDTCEEIMLRFKKSGNIAARLFALASDSITGRINTQNLGENEIAVAVFNTQCFDTDCAVDFELRYYAEKAPVCVRAYDADGSEVMIHTGGRRTTGTIESDYTRVQKFSQDTFVSATLLAKKVPAFGYKVYRIVPENGPSCLKKLADEKSLTAENPFLILSVSRSGTLSVYDKISGTRYENLNCLLYQTNGGDAYNFRHILPERDKDSRSLKWDICCSENSAALAEFELSAVWTLPAGLNENMDAPLDETVDEKIAIKVRLTADSPVIHIRTTIDNKAKDHRISAVFPLGFPVRDIAADSPFYIEHRGTESLGTRQPGSTFVNAAGTGAALAVLHRGLHQYSVSPDGTLNLALLQAQGAIYRSFFKNYNATYSGCECIGTYTMEYALYPNGGDLPAVIKEAALYGSGMKTAQTGRHEGSLGWECCAMKVIGGNVRLTSVKRTEDGGMFAARFVNDGGRTENAVIYMRTDEKAAYLMTAQEKIISETGITGGMISLTVKPYEIVTLGIKNGLKL